MGEIKQPAYQQDVVGCQRAWLTVSVVLIGDPPRVDSGLRFAECSLELY